MNQPQIHSGETSPRSVHPRENSPAPAVAIVGPTASGKSSLALALAESLDAEIINYDSMQLYRLFDLGTAKPEVSIRERVPHHLIDVLDPEALCSAGDYRRMAVDVMNGLRRRGRIPLLVGGTGLYLRALTEGLFEGPRRSDDWRPRLGAIGRRRGPAYLHRILQRLDPAAARRIAVQDTPKVVRALEVRLVTGRPLSRHWEDSPSQPVPGYRFTLIGLDPPRAELYERIEQRVRGMYRDGLVSEVQRVLDQGVSREAYAFRAIGYRQVLAHIDGFISMDEAIMLTARETRRYAKRQWTWFRKQHDPVWFQGFGSEAGIQDAVGRYLACALHP